jgi:hypothetical protein
MDFFSSEYTSSEAKKENVPELFFQWQQPLQTCSLSLPGLLKIHGERVHQFGELADDKPGGHVNAVMPAD